MKTAKPGHERTSPDKRRIVLEQLLGGESQAAAARAADISDKTVRRWLQEAGFIAELEKARTAAFSEALGELKGGTAAAVKTLLRNLRASSPAERRAAAKEILSFAFRGIEVLDFEARLERIEKLLEEQGPRARVS